MTASLYARLSAPFRPYAGAIRALNRLLTLSVYIAYPALLLFLLLTRDPRLLRAVIAPGVSFAALTLFRKWCNAPRPYEVLDITPSSPRTPGATPSPAATCSRSLSSTWPSGGCAPLWAGYSWP